MAGATALSTGSLPVSTPSRATRVARAARRSPDSTAGISGVIDDRPPSLNDMPDRGHAETVRLVLIDEPTLSRRCLAAYLQRRRGLQVVADAGTGDAGLALVRSLKPDVVIVEPGVSN